MEENTPTENIEVIETQTIENQPTPEPTEQPKKTRKKKEQQVEISIEEPNPEIDKLKAELAAMLEEKQKLENEKNALTDTISKLQEEVKITPQKLGKAIKEMGIEPLSVARDNPQTMTLERYNSLSDSARREWQRSHRADFLNLMHNTKITQ